jgi:pyruvate/2-oxoacid:ferredoxin oxidoreductase beta subunit
MITTFSLQEAQSDDLREKILLPPTDPSAEVMEIPGYKLVYVNGACPRNYRVYKADSMIGVIFQHITHWSTGVDSLRYAEPVDAAVGLDEFLNVAKILRTATKQPLTEEELLDKEFDSLTSEDWERLKREIRSTSERFGCSVRKWVGSKTHLYRKEQN